MQLVPRFGRKHGENVNGHGKHQAETAALSYKLLLNLSLYYSTFLLQKSRAQNIKNTLHKYRVKGFQKLSEETQLHILENDNGVQSKLDAFCVFNVLILWQWWVFQQYWILSNTEEPKKWF